MDILGQLKKMIALTFRSGSYSITLKGKDSPALSKDITIEIADGDATQEMVTDGSTNTLTNKTISSADNTLTIDADVATVSNIDNDNIKASAAIDATKLGSGTVDNTELGYLDGVTSSIQTQINTDVQNLADHEAEVTGAHAASAISYDNATSGLTATTAQAAVDEVEGRLDTAESNISTNTSNIGTNTTDIANIELKTDHITVTQAVDLDTIESDTALNNAHRTTVTGNPHAVTKTEVGLGNVPDVDATNASNISSGTLADARLSSNVDLLDTAQTITGEKTLEKQVWAEGTAINNNASTTLAQPDKTIISLTGNAAETNIETITATTVTSERIVVLRNDTAGAGDNTFVVRSTGNIALSGDDIELAPNATLILQYNGTAWVVIGGSGAGGGSVKAEYYTHSTLPSPLTIGKFYVVDLSAGNATATMPTLDADSDKKNIEIWPVNVGVTGNTITLTAGGTDKFNDPDLGLDTVYVMDVGRAKYVADYDGGVNNVWHVADAYWNTAMEMNTGDWTVNGSLTVTEALIANTTDSISSNLDVSGISNLSFTAGTGTITGLSGGVKGQRIRVYGSSAYGDVLFSFNDAGGTQKFLTTESKSVRLNGYAGVELYCDGTFWFVTSVAPSYSEASGTFGSAPTGYTLDGTYNNWNATKVGNVVTLKYRLKFTYSSPADTSPIFNLTGLPTHMRPSQQGSAVIVPFTYSGAGTAAFHVLNEGGTISMYGNQTYGGFAGSGTAYTGHASASLGEYWVSVSYFSDAD